MWLTGSRAGAGHHIVEPHKKVKIQRTRKTMNERISRINDYAKFKADAKEIFTALSEKDPSHKRLHELFSLCICPGGSMGGVSEKEVEVFYGNRPIGTETTIGPDFNVVKKTEIARGAMLAYFRTDDGHVICNLYPAKSENQNPIEEIFLLDYIKNPSQLKAKAESHWKMFISCMESTCIDGNPNFGHKLRYFYVTNFKEFVVGGILQPRKVTTMLKEISKYVLTIWLSGFLILIFTLVKANIDNKENERKARQMQQTIENLSKRAENIEESLKTSNHLLQGIIDGQKLAKPPQKP